MSASQQNNQRRPQARRYPPQQAHMAQQKNTANANHARSMTNAKADKPQKPKIQFSKILTGFIAMTMYPVSIYVIVECLDLAKLAIEQGFTGSLPYITAIVGFVEAAITIVMACYFDNSKAEKVAGYNSGAYTSGCVSSSSTINSTLNRDY